MKYIIISDRRNKKLDKLYFSGVIFFLKMFCMNSASYSYAKLVDHVVQNK